MTPALPRHALAAILALAALSACEAPTAPDAALTPGARFVVAAIDAAPAPQGVTLEIPEAGRIAGQAPCNRYFTSFSQEGATLSTGPAGATRMACPEGGRMEAETAFLGALEAVTTIAPGPEAGQIALGDGTRTRLLLVPAD